jgi:hypothetical protein
MADRQRHSVRARADGQGDGWARAHREQLGAAFHMTDLDGAIGLMGFAANTGERLFIEYVPDAYGNRLHVIRRFATVAVFDRKTSREYAFSEANRVSLAWHLDVCRRLAATQHSPPRFFLVIGRDRPPWELLELDIHSGGILSEHRLDAMNWRVIGEQAGLTALRNELRHWIKAHP